MKPVVFSTYIPEAHGYHSGTDNGHYASAMQFRIVGQQYQVRKCTSGDSYVFPWPSWQEVSADEYNEAMNQAMITDAQEKAAFNRAMDDFWLSLSV